MRLVGLAFLLACSNKRKEPPPAPPPVPETAIDASIPVLSGEPITPDAKQVSCSSSECVSSCRDGDESACRGYRQWVYEQSYPKPEAALEVATSGCKRGSPAACLLIGDLDTDMSVESTERACNLGGDEACWLYANWLSDGRYVTQDRARAKILWQQACERSYIPACYTLALDYETDGKLADAAKWYERGCNGLEPDACYELGLLYADGRGVQADRKRALELLAKGCNGASYGLACDAYHEVNTRKDPPETITIRTFVIRAPGQRSVPDAQRAAEKAVRAIAGGTAFHVAATAAGGEDVSEPTVMYRHVSKNEDEEKIFALKPGTARADLSYMGMYIVFRER